MKIHADIIFDTIEVILSKQILHAYIMMVIYVITLYSSLFLLDVGVKIVIFLTILTLTLCFLILRIFKIPIASFSLLFLISTSVFVFGRFIALAISFLLPVELSEQTLTVPEIFNVGWMTSFLPDELESRYLVFTINCFVILFCCGFLLGYKANVREGIDMTFNIGVLKIIFFICMAYTLKNVFANIALIQSAGYLALYSEQGLTRSATDGVFDSIVGIITIVSFAFIVSYSQNVKLYVVIFLFYTLLTGLMGTRGVLITNLMMIIFLISNRFDFKVNLFKLFSCLALMYIIMNVIVGFSGRGGDHNLNLAQFIYNQGTTLGVISFSIYGIEYYPLHTMMQSFIPMYFRFYSLFNPDVPGYTAAMVTYITYTADSNLFNLGFGLGSSIISELFILSQKSLTIFSMLTLTIGFLLGRLEKKAMASSLYFVYLISIMPILLFSPRDGFNIVFTKCFYTFVLVVVFAFIFRVKSKE